MQDLQSIYENIITRINEKSNEPAIIYTGIGTRAGMRKEDGTLASENYHQYPPFLQDIKNNIPLLNLFIVLIDPYQENPPYMIEDKGFNSDKPLDEQYEYRDENKKITVYVLKKNVTVAPYIKTADIAAEDISGELRYLNKYAARSKNVTTVYHDFTGRRNDLVAEYFDEEIDAKKLNHIIYGLSLREDNGCYFDLNAISSFLPFRLNMKRVEFFNIYQYIAENRIEEISGDAKKYYPEYMLPMINIQSEKLIAAIKTEFKNNIFSTMRILLKLIRGEENREEVVNFHIFGYISSTKRGLIEEKFKEGMYRELFDYLMDFFTPKMEMLVKLKKLDLTAKELMGFVINEHEKDMYNWYTNLNYFIS